MATRSPRSSNQNAARIAQLERELAEAHAREASTAEILKVISRSTFELQPVLDSLIENAVRLCAAGRGFLFRVDGSVGIPAASYNVDPDLLAFYQQHGIPIGRGSVTGRAALERRTVQVADVTADPEYENPARRVVDYSTVLATPLIRNGELLG